MYYKNTSDKATIIVNTLGGKFAVKPLEVVNLPYNLLPPISSKLKQVTKEEYIDYKRGTTDKPTTKSVKTENNKQEEVKQSAPEVISVDLEEQINCTPTISKKDTNKIIEEISEELSDDNIMDYVKSLLLSKPIPNFEEMGEEPKTDPMVAVEITCDDKKEELRQKINVLKESWLRTRTATKKDKLTKQIKEFQKQLDKLEKDFG